MLRNVLTKRGKKKMLQIEAKYSTNRGFQMGIANSLSLDRICCDIYTVKNTSKVARFDSGFDHRGHYS